MSIPVVVPLIAVGAHQQSHSCSEELEACYEGMEYYQGPNRKVGKERKFISASCDSLFSVLLLSVILDKCIF